MTRSEWQLMLRDEILRRQKRDPAYSANRFARVIGVSRGFLSQVLAGKKKLTYERGAAIAARLEWSRARSARFLRSLIIDTVPSRRLRAFLRATLTSPS